MLKILASKLLYNQGKESFLVVKKHKQTKNAKPIYLTGYSYHAKHIKMCKNKKVSKQIKVGFDFDNLHLLKCPQIQSLIKELLNITLIST